MMHVFILAAIAALGQAPVLDDQSFERWRDSIRPPGQGRVLPGDPLA